MGEKKDLKSREKSSRKYGEKMIKSLNSLNLSFDRSAGVQDANSILSVEILISWAQ